MERESLTRQCPYCGEAVEVEVDLHGPHSEQYTEDCPVCCRPWVVRVGRGEEDEEESVEVELMREDD